MAITENRVVTTYIADTSQERSAIDALMRKVDQLKAVETSAAREREQHFDQLVLDITRAARAENEFTETVKGSQGAYSSATKGIQSFAKELAPWNQALNLGGKAIRFATEGLDEYAKTSPYAAKQVKELESRFTSLKHTVMSAVGEMTVALLDDAVAIDKIGKKFQELENTGIYKKFYRSDGSVRNIHDIAVSFYGEEGAKQLFANLQQSGYLKSVNADDPLGALTSSLDKMGGALKKSLKDTTDYWSTEGSTLVDSMAAGMEKERDAMRKAKEEAAALAKELRDQAAARALLHSATISEGRNIAGTFQVGTLSADEYSARQSAAYSRGMLGEKADVGGYDLAGNSMEQQIVGMTALRDQTQAWHDELDKYNAGRGKDLFDKLGIPDPDEFNLRTEAILTLTKAFTDSLGPALEAFATGQLTGAQAAKKAAGQVVHAIGDRLAANAAAEAVEGAAMLLTLNPAGGLHLGAAALYGAGAVAAYATAAKLGAGGGSVSTPSGGGSSAGGGAVPGRWAGDPNDHRGAVGTGGGGKQSAIIVYADPFAEDSPRQRALRAEQLVKKALGGLGGSDD